MTDYMVDVEVAGTLIDSCDVALPLEIVHGRSSVINQPDAPTASFTYLGATPPAQLGQGLNIIQRIPFDGATWGDPVATWADAAVLWGGGDESETPRFVGFVDSLEAQEQGGQVVSWQVGCVGHQATLGSRFITISRPAEADTVRVDRIAAAAGRDVLMVGDPGITLAATVYEKVDALSAIHDVCASTGGLLWQASDGFLWYGTAAHRQELETRTVDCEVIADGLGWAQSVDDIINDVTAKFGATGETTFTDGPSKDMPWGTRHADVSSMAAAEADAEQLAQLILRRRAWPYWSSPAVLVYADEFDPAELKVLAAVEVSSGILLPLPIGEPGPVPSDVSLGVVEGWVETWDESGHTMQLAVSDSARWNDIRPRTWAEVATQTWGYWKTHGSWTDTLIKEPGDPV